MAKRKDFDYLLRTAWWSRWDRRTMIDGGRYQGIAAPGRKLHGDRSTSILQDLNFSLAKGRNFTKQNHTVTCMVIMTKANDRRTSSPLTR
ncbi:hypothetical protein TNCV_1982311 [Trichonephila clavipes]|nr:hypothetical protein TNCV_1982311 [Trichonephila clavipes]